MQPRRDFVTPQQVLLARLIEFGRSEPPAGSALWSFLRDKLSEMESQVRELKDAQVGAYQDWFLDKVGQGEVSEEDTVELKTLLDAYLSPGDYADVAIHLDPATLSDKERRTWAAKILRSVRASPLAQAGERGKRLIAEIEARVGIDALANTLRRKPKTALRKRMALRRLRRNVAEYCSVLHFPSTPLDSIRPFLLLRVEALVAACRRFLDLCR